MGGGSSKVYNAEQVTEVLEDHTHILQKLHKDVETKFTSLQQKCDKQDALISEQASTIRLQRTEIEQLSKTCIGLKTVEDERKAVAADRLNLEKKLVALRRQEELLSLPFDCTLCRETRTLKDLTAFCASDPRLQRLSGLHEDEHQCFMLLRPSMQEYFDQMDKGSKGFWDANDTSRALKMMERARVPEALRGRQRQADEISALGTREKRIAMQEFRAKRSDMLTFEEFWDRLADANYRPPMFVLHFMLQETFVSTDVIDCRFPHKPKESLE